MEDYEIRDVMNRSKHPRNVLSFTAEWYIAKDDLGFPEYDVKKRKEALLLRIYGENQGAVLARYVIGQVVVPEPIVSPYDIIRRSYTSSNEIPKTLTANIDNKTQDHSSMGIPVSDVRFEPVLPTLTLFMGSVHVRAYAMSASNQDDVITWRVHADNASPSSGECHLADIAVIDSRRE